MMKNDLLTPTGIAAVLFNGNHAQIFHWAREVIRAAHFLHILVAPSIIPLVSQEVALNPALRRLGLVAVSGEGSFPNAPKHA